MPQITAVLLPLSCLVTVNVHPRALALLSVPLTARRSNVTQIVGPYVTTVTLHFTVTSFVSQAADCWIWSEMAMLCILQTLMQHLLSVLHNITCQPYQPSSFVNQTIDSTNLLQICHVQTFVKYIIVIFFCLSWGMPVPPSLFSLSLASRCLILFHLRPMNSTMSHVDLNE